MSVTTTIQSRIRKRRNEEYEFTTAIPIQLARAMSLRKGDRLEWVLVKGKIMLSKVM